MQKNSIPAKPFITELLKLNKSKTKSETFYTKNARMPLFMLQAIARLNLKAFGGKTTENYLKLFKKLEDQLGVVDYYDALHKQFKAIPSIEVETLNYFERKKNKALSKLEKYIVKADLDICLKNATEELAFPNEQVAIQKLKQAYTQELNAIAAFMNDNKSGFTDMELHTHELRRKLRWLSIYAQAYGGLFVLKSATKKQAWEKLYVNDTAKKSPFNKLPISKSYTHTIALDTSSFYALSFLIQQFGSLKDEGLSMEALQKAIRKTKDISKKEAEKETISLLKPKQTTATLLKNSFALATNSLQKHKVLGQLIAT
jgi:hypothetical protein